MAGIQQQEQEVGKGESRSSKPWVLFCVRAPKSWSTGAPRQKSCGLQEALGLIRRAVETTGRCRMGRDAMQLLFGKVGLYGVDYLLQVAGGVPPSSGKKQ